MWSVIYQSFPPGGSPLHCTVIQIQIQVWLIIGRQCTEPGILAMYSYSINVHHQRKGHNVQHHCSTSMYFINAKACQPRSFMVVWSVVTAQHGWIVDSWDGVLVTENQPNTLIHQLQHRKNRSNQKSISGSKRRKISKWSPRETNCFLPSISSFYPFFTIARYTTKCMITCLL